MYYLKVRDGLTAFIQMVRFQFLSLVNCFECTSVCHDLRIAANPTSYYSNVLYKAFSASTAVNIKIQRSYLVYEMYRTAAFKAHTGHYTRFLKANFPYTHLVPMACLSAALDITGILRWNCENVLTQQYCFL